MSTLRNFQSEIEEIHARERAKQRTTQTVRVLPSQEGQRRQAHASSPSDSGTRSTSLYALSNSHSSEQEQQILVNCGSSVVGI